MIKDPYFSTDACVNRLYKTYKIYNILMIAVDFDSTIFPWESKDHEFPQVIEIIKKCNDLGFYVTIFTASSTDRYEMIKKHCTDIGIKIDGINENPVKGLPYGNNGKILFNVLLDDRAGLFQAYEILQATIKLIEENKEQEYLKS